MIRKIRILLLFCLSFALLPLASVRVSADTIEKKLYFEERSGTMEWNQDKSENIHYFMRFKNMLPGETYFDKMKIENGTRKTYELFMQTIPLEQTDLADVLLQKIEMKVRQDGQLIYQGNAAGQSFDRDASSLLEVVPLGIYAPEKGSKLDVELRLDPNLGIEYSDLLTQIDWKFMVQERPEAPKKPSGEPSADPTVNKKQLKEIKPPKTGDPMQRILWSGVGACAFLGIAGILLGKRKAQQKD